MPFNPPNDMVAMSKSSQCARYLKTVTFIESERQKLFRVIISHPRYTKHYTKWCSADLQFLSDWSERGSQLRHPSECQDLGANQLWSGEDKPTPTRGSPQGSASTGDEPGDLVVWAHCEQMNSWSWDHQVRWQRQNKLGFTIGNTGKLSNQVGNMFVQVLVL